MAVQFVYICKGDGMELRVNPVPEGERIEISRYGAKSFWLSYEDAEHLRTSVLPTFFRDVLALRNEDED